MLPEEIEGGETPPIDGFDRYGCPIEDGVPPPPIEGFDIYGCVIEDDAPPPIDGVDIYGCAIEDDPPPLKTEHAHPCEPKPRPIDPKTGLPVLEIDLIPY